MKKLIALICLFIPGGISASPHFLFPSAFNDGEKTDVAMVQAAVIRYQQQLSGSTSLGLYHINPVAYGLGFWPLSVGFLSFQYHQNLGPNSAWSIGLMTQWAAGEMEVYSSEGFESGAVYGSDLPLVPFAQFSTRVADAEHSFGLGLFKVAGFEWGTSSNPKVSALFLPGMFRSSTIPGFVYAASFFTENTIQMWTEVWAMGVFPFKGETWNGQASVVASAMAGGRLSLEPFYVDLGLIAGGWLGTELRGLLPLLSLGFTW